MHRGITLQILLSSLIFLYFSELDNLLDSTKKCLLQYAGDVT